MTCSVLLLAGGCTFQRPSTHRDVPAADFHRLFTPEELKADLRDFLATAEDVHPDLYRETSREAVAASLGELEHELAAPRTRLEFYPIAARLAAKFNDAHTGIQSPREEWAHFCNAGGLLFPPDVECRDGALRVLHTFDPHGGLQPGDTLQAINNCSVAGLLDTFRREHGGARAWVDALIARRLRSLLWVHGVRAPFEVEGLRASDGAKFTAHLDGVTAAAITSASAGAPTPGSYPNYRFERLPDNIGYLDFRSMADGQAFDAFLKQTFTTLHNQPSAGLIIDLRRNGGGDSRLGDALLSYLTDKPYKMADRKEWKVSRQYREYLKAHVAPALRWLPLQWFHPVGWKYWSTPVGKIAVFGGDLQRPGPNPLRYTGPVCFLIGPFTFSSALMLANAVEDYDLATLIAQETGASPNGFGEVYSFDLPRTRLEAAVSTALFVRANGDAMNRRGVQPDIVVTPMPDDERAEVDTVLERAKRWVIDAAAHKRQSGEAGCLQPKAVAGEMLGDR